VYAGLSERPAGACPDSHPAPCLRGDGPSTPYWVVARVGFTSTVIEHAAAFDLVEIGPSQPLLRLTSLKALM